jgi:DNA-binding GntR family transcriptional regulator
MLMIPDKRLALLAYEKVLALIMSGEARAGSMVNERRLADMLRMSRTPVRDALLMLEGEGLVVRQGARGLQVRQLRIEEFLHALQVRILLEPEAARLAAGQLQNRGLIALSDRLIAIRTDPDAVERDEVRDVDNTLHDLIADAAGNPQMASVIRTMRRQTQVFDLKSVPERTEGTCAEHLSLIQALDKGDRDAAAEAMKYHLEGVRRSIVVRLTGG